MGFFRAKFLNKSTRMLNFAIIQSVFSHIIEIKPYICKLKLGLASVDLTGALLMTKGICRGDR